MIQFRTLVFLVVGGLAGLGRAADLTFLNGAEPETLDPAIITGQPEGRVVNALFEGLLRYDAKGRGIPGTAESWEISPDGKTYTFHLRDNARWSDGRPVTAEDFVRSWRRTLSPATASPYNYMLFPIRHAEAFAEGKLADFHEVGVKALDARTLRVELAHATSYFLDLCAVPALHPVPVDLIDHVGDAWVKPEHIVTNGPFRLEKWRLNDSITLRKNPDYWDAAAVSLDEIRVLPISKAEVALNFYASGGADLMMDKGLAPPALLDELVKRPDFHAAPFLGIYFIRFNCEKPPFNDARVRQAFSLVVDQNRIVKGITRAGELPAASFVPPGIEGYPAAEGLRRDPERARKLLAEAGFPGGRGFPLVSYLYSEGALNEAISVELQSMWRRELGVNVNLDRQEWKVYLNSLNSLDYDIGRSSWVGDYPDPTTFLDMLVTNNGNNRTGWSSEKYDSLIRESGRELVPARRFERLRAAESFLLREGTPIFPIYYYVGIQIYDGAKFGG
ncbi:MAG TPA: peptide ABC transporter substrate-binding protein, partial [Chthoniobacterales bacterium]